MPRLIVIYPISIHIIGDKDHKGSYPLFHLSLFIPLEGEGVLAEL
jgi:hypothetical protein